MDEPTVRASPCARLEKHRTPRSTTAPRNVQVCIDVHYDDDDDDDDDDNNNNNNNLRQV